MATETTTPRDVPVKAYREFFGELPSHDNRSIDWTDTTEPADSGRRTTMETETTERYAVVDRPGFFGNNQATVYSTHGSMALAVRAMRRAAYIDERQQRRLPCCVVRTTTGKGGVIYGDIFPEVLA